MQGVQSDDYHLSCRDNILMIIIAVHPQHQQQS